MEKSALFFAIIREGRRAAVPKMKIIDRETKETRKK
jgi:hypothetical protein